jgi:Ca2+-transporting ATPase
MPVGKEADIVATADAPLGDRLNMVYMNTLLTRGRAELVVTATGMHTEMGQLSKALETKDETPSPLQIQLDQLAKRLGVVALSMVALLSLLQYLRGVKLTEMLLHYR